MPTDPKWLLLAAALALMATFARPTWPAERARFEHVVVLDVTQSMNVEDEEWQGRPASRLEAAKGALRQAIEALPCGSKIGWAIFTEYRSYLLFTPVEVCAHRAELRDALGRIDGRMAWSGNSEVAKGLHSAIGIARQLKSTTGTPSLVFVTDGHEAPPLDPNQRPAFDDKPGEVAGVIVGVGALKPSPMPKSDALGRPLGFWSADDVAQTNPHQPNRDLGGRDEVPAASLGATRGSEHLSSLREGYLRLLANENGLAYARLRGDGLAAALGAPALSRPVKTTVDLRNALAALALLLLLVQWLPWRRSA
jgi:mxaL protein